MEKVFTKEDIKGILDTQDSSGYTFLMRAVERDDITQVKKLIEFGVDVDKVNKDDISALIIAINHKNIKIVKELLKAGANVNYRNKKSYTPLLYAIYGGASIVKELLKAGADVKMEMQGGNSILIEASNSVFNINEDIIDLLIESGVDVDHSNFDGYTAIEYAALKRNYKMLRKLIKVSRVNKNVLAEDIKEYFERRPKEIRDVIEKYVIKTGDIFTALNSIEMLEVMEVL